MLNQSPGVADLCICHSGPFIYKQSLTCSDPFFSTVSIHFHTDTINFHIYIGHVMFKPAFGLNKINTTETHTLLCMRVEMLTILSNRKILSPLIWDYRLLGLFDIHVTGLKQCSSPGAVDEHVVPLASISKSYLSGIATYFY